MTDEDSFKARFKVFRSSPPEQPEKLMEIEDKLLEQFTQREDEFRDALKKLVSLYIQTGRQKVAAQYMEKLALFTKDPGEQAIYYLSLGQLMEQIRDYESATTYYLKAQSLEPTSKYTWYFINNNLGYCLNHFGKFAEAEQYCRLAIKIDPDRHNAHKNLGVSLEGQGHFAEAARCFLKAVRSNAADPRAMQRLLHIVTEHPEISREIPDIQDQLRSCQEAITKVRSIMEKTAREAQKNSDNLE